MMISGYKSKDTAKDRQLMECALLEYVELPVDFYSIKKLPKSYQRVLFLYLKIEKSRDKLTVVNYGPATFYSALLCWLLW